MRRIPLALAFMLSACVAGPPPIIDTSPPPLPEAFAFTPDAKTDASLAALLPQEDPAFRALANAAIAEGPTLAQATARIEAARAQADRAGADRLPIVTADASVAGTRTNPDQIGASLPSGLAIDNERVRYAANLTASWDIDLFGRLRARAEAAQARLDAANAQAGAVRNALIAEIAGSVVDWRTLDARALSLQKDLTAAENLARLSGVREDAGISPGFDRVRAQSASAASRSRLIALESERARLVGRLVTLTGQDARTVLTALRQPVGSPEFPAAPATLPSQLLMNRPDVLAAAASLDAADSDLAATAAQRFPQITLSAVVGLLAFDLGELFDEDAVVGSAGGSVLAPLLDFGRIESEIDASSANKRLAFAQYREAVFTALGDAETGYALIAATDREASAAQQEAQELARAGRLADTRYRAGLSDFLTVLEALRAADASGERAAAARGRALRARILLWRALGGDAATTHTSGGI